MLQELLNAEPEPAHNLEPTNPTLPRSIHVQAILSVESEIMRSPESHSKSG